MNKTQNTVPDTKPVTIRRRRKPPPIIYIFKKIQTDYDLESTTKVSF